MRSVTTPAAAGAMAGLALALAASAASAATINFADGSLDNPTKTYTEGDFQFVPASLTSGNCPGDAPCLLQNNGAFSDVTMTTVSGDPFDLDGFSYHFVGDETQQRSVLTVSDSIIRTFTQADFGNDPFTLSFDDEFDNVDSIVFSYAGPGSGRLDNILAALSGNPGPGPVPLPAALPLLLTAFGGLGFFGWRRRAGRTA